METATQRTATQAMGAIPRYAAGGPMRLKKPAKPGAASVMADGGAIKGKGTGTSDEVPIMASNGEYMIRAAAVEEIGTEVLDAINKLGDDNEPDEAMESESKDGKPAMKKGGAVKCMATGGPVVDEQQRAAMVAQIPTGGTGAGPTPQPNPELSASSTELGRNVGNAFNALAPLAGGTALVNGASRLGSALGASTAVGKLATGVSQAMPYVVPAVAAGSLGVAASPATPVATPAAPAPIPAAAKPAAPQPRPGAPNPASGSPDEAMPDGKVNVSKQANGVMSFSGKNISGQPQYTGSAANTMQGGAMNTMQAMPQAEINRALTNPDGSRWSANDNAIMAANIRDGVNPYRGTSRGIAEAAQNDLQNLALSPNGTPGKGNAMKLLAMQADDKRSAAQQQIEKDRNAQTAQLATAKDGREATASAMDQKAKQQLMDAQQEYLNAGDDPVKQKAAERKLMTLGNKQGKAPTFHPGSRIKNVDGSETVTPAYVFDPSTMEAREVGQSGQAALPPGMVKQVGTANGKPVYLDKNGKQVIAKG